MNDEEKKAIEYLENSLARTVTHRMMLERIKDLIKKLQKELEIANDIRFKALKRVSELESENAQLRTKPNNKDKMIEMMAKELYHRVDNGVFGDSVEEIIDHFRKKVKDE